LTLKNTVSRDKKRSLMTIVDDPAAGVLNPLPILKKYFSHCHPEAELIYSKVAVNCKNVMETYKIQFPNRDIWYFPGKNSVPTNNVGKNSLAKWMPQMAELCGASNFEKCTNHGLRKLMITTAMDRGLHPLTVANVARHSSLNSQQAYGKHSKKRKQQTAMALSTSGTLAPPKKEKKKEVQPSKFKTVDNLIAEQKTVPLPSDSPSVAFGSSQSDDDDDFTPQEKAVLKKLLQKKAKKKLKKKPRVSDENENLLVAHGGAGISFHPRHSFKNPPQVPPYAHVPMYPRPHYHPNAPLSVAYGAPPMMPPVAPSVQYAQPNYAFPEERQSYGRRVSGGYSVTYNFGTPGPHQMANSQQPFFHSSMYNPMEHHGQVPYANDPYIQGHPANAPPPHFEDAPSYYSQIPDRHGAVYRDQFGHPRGRF
jgi:hypothetical protein